MSDMEKTSDMYNLDNIEGDIDSFSAEIDNAKLNVRLNARLKGTFYSGSYKELLSQYLTLYNHLLLRLMVSKELKSSRVYQVMVRKLIKRMTTLLD